MIENKKLVITKVNNGLCYCLFKNERYYLADIFYDDHKIVLNNIYVGHVRDKVNNINAAFVEYDKDTLGYLSLNDTKDPVFLNRKNTDKICEGDRIIIQIIKDRIKTKDAVVTTNFTLNGKYAVLAHGKKKISISSKITDIQFKKNIKNVIESFLSQDDLDNFGIIVRTNAYLASSEELINEISSLKEEYYKLLDTAKTREKHYILKTAENPLITLIRDLDLKENDKIITDEINIFKELKNSTETKCTIDLYKDELLPLYKLYSLEKIFSEITQRKIWLKSGGYIIIDYTEAMTVIDVNSGKCIRGKNQEKTFLDLNLEAAEEIARQLSLRNISGIIMIDFIDMSTPENKNLLMDKMKEFVLNDKIKTNVIDYTKLHLMELTRKKTRDKVYVRDNIFSKDIDNTQSI